MKLVSFGDEIVYANDAAPALAAKRLGFEFENLADTDTTNSRIHKKIVKKCIAIQDEDPTDYIFLIGWTTPFRLDAEYEGEYFSYKKDSTDYKNTMMNKLHNYDHYLFNNIVISQRFVSIVYGVQQMLENKRISYYMYNTQENLHYNTYTEKTLRNLNHKFYFDAIGAKSTMIEYLHAKGYDKKLSVQAHEDYSRFICQKLRSSGIVERPR